MAVPLTPFVKMKSSGVVLLSYKDYSALVEYKLPHPPIVREISGGLLCFEATLIDDHKEGFNYLWVKMFASFGTDQFDGFRIRPGVSIRSI